MKYILASASPRRKELLHHILTDFEIIPSDVEEIVPNELPITQAPEYLSALKARDIAQNHTDSVVIGADTGVFIDGKMLGKPKDRQHAFEMLSDLSGRTHQVITGCTICYGTETISFTSVTDVTFYPLSQAQIEWYLDTNEPFDKAGGYGIQSKGVVLVQKINGDYSNVVGLPVAELARVLENLKKHHHF